MGILPFIGSHFHFILSLICFISIDGSNSLYSNIIQFVDLIHVHYYIGQMWLKTLQNFPILQKNLLRIFMNFFLLCLPFFLILVLSSSNYSSLFKHQHSFQKTFPHWDLLIKLGSTMFCTSLLHQYLANMVDIVDNAKIKKYLAIGELVP
jgi:hypothetical protein